MHILHVLFTRHRGGLEQAYVNDTEAMVSRGHKVTALLRHDAPYLPEVQPIAQNVITEHPNGFYDIFAIARMREMLRKVKPDCIIAHNGRAIALLAYARFCLGIPLIGVSHSYKTARARHADMLVVLSQHMRQHFADHGFHKPITVIPNLMHLPPKPAPKPRGNPVVIGAIGRFSEEKGFTDFLYTLAELKSMGLAFKVRLGGDGPELEQLKSLEKQLGLEGIIEWLGWVGDKPAFYRELDILCIPSREDSFPMVLLETLAYGVPIVATDAPGPASVLTDGENGLLVKRRDRVGLAKALYRVATQPALAEKLVAGGFIKSQDFGFDHVANEWHHLLQSVIK